VKSVELLPKMRRQHPAFATIQQDAEYETLIYLAFGGERE
jgi:hypothetical protein